MLSSSASSLIIIETFMFKDVQYYWFDKQSSLYALIKNPFSIESDLHYTWQFDAHRVRSTIISNVEPFYMTIFPVLAPKYKQC